MTKWKYEGLSERMCAVLGLVIAVGIIGAIFLLAWVTQ